MRTYEELFEYDDFNNLIKYTDRCKNVYRYEYDVFGNMTSKTDASRHTPTQPSMAYANRL